MTLLLFMGGWAGSAQADSALSALETRWLKLAWPAVNYAKAQGLPLDIVVQPQPTPGNAPLAMAFIDQRCKLVLSMRGNPEAQSTLDELPPALLAPLVEAMAAHELGHCWRYVRGGWHTLPAGFAAPRDAGRGDAPADAPAHASTEASTKRQLHEMQQTRREEGFADLVALAWTLRHHPDHYAQVHAWFMAFRGEVAHPGSHHDTMAWIRLVPEARAFTRAATPFDEAWPLWQQGLRSTEGAGRMSAAIPHSSDD